MGVRSSDLSDQCLFKSRGPPLPSIPDREGSSTRIKNAMASEITRPNSNRLFSLGIYQNQGIHEELSKSRGFEGSNLFTLSESY